MTEQAQQPDSLDGIEYVGMPDTADTDAKMANYVRSVEAEENAHNEPLELGTEEAPEATAEDVAADEDKKKGRSKRWETRVDNLTARLREAERLLAEARAGGGTTQNAPTNVSVEEVTARKPNPDNFEWGTADPGYAEAITDWKIDLREAKAATERKQSAEADQQQTAYNEQVSKLNEGMVKIEQVGKEKYEDFDDKIAEAIEARGGEPLHPLISVGTAVSPAGADIAYRLATDEKASDRLESLAKTNPHAAALAFGELEGEYLDSDEDLNLADPMDMLRLNGRMKSRLAGKGPSAAAERKVSKAPEPPESRARGTGGRFTPDWSAENVDLNELGKQLR